MANQSTLFGLVMLGVIFGSAILLYGVNQTHGESLNGIMLVGGVIVLASTGLLSVAVSGVDRTNQ